jgi:hypothetical protein
MLAKVVAKIHRRKVNPSRPPGIGATAPAGSESPRWLLPSPRT